MKKYFLVSCLLFITHAIAVKAETSDEGEIRVPLMDDRQLVRIPIRVFGQIAYFIVDTGTSTTTLDTKFASRLGRPLAHIKEQSSAEDIEADLYHAPKIVIGGAEIPLERVVCGDLSLQRLVTGEECDGVLGMDVLRKYVVTMNFERNEFVLSKNISLPREAKYIPMTAVGAQFQVEASIGAKSPILLMIDSGLTNSLSLNQDEWDQMLTFEERASALHVIFAAAGGQIVENRMTRLSTVTLAGTSYPKLICTLLPREGLSTLGLSFLRQYHVVLDFPHSTFYFEPSKSDWVEEKDMSGLHLIRKEGKVMVYSVDLKSPAAIADIRPGDVMERIDDEIASTISMASIRAKLMSRDGDGRNLTMDRGDHKLEIHLVLRRQI